MTMSITTLNNQSTEPSDQSNQNHQTNSTTSIPQPPSKNSSSHPQRTRKSKLLANRRRRSRNQPDYDEDLEAEQNDQQSTQNHLTTGSDSTSSDCDDSTTSSLSNSNSDLSVDEFEQDQSQFLDLEAGHQGSLQSESSNTFVPNKIAKIKPGQTPTDDPSQSPTAHSTATQPSLTSSSATRRHKQQPSPTSTTTTTTTTTSTNQTNNEDITTTTNNNNTPSTTTNNNTTIIFNQGSWITGLNTNTNEDHPTVQTQRYIPFIEFDNFNAYGSLIFDLNTGLSSRSRVECKPDGLEKAPPEALEEKFVRMSLSTDLPNHESMQEIEQEQAAARRALKKREKRLSKLRGDKRPNSRPSSGTPLTVNIISPSQPNNRHSSHRPGSPLPSSTRPPSSLAGHATNRPPSAFSNAISEPNHSAAASEEPWTIPRSGRFWGHDDRQSHSQRGGRGMRGGPARGSHARGRGGGGGGGGGITRGAGHHGKGGFRADWEEQRRHQPNLHPNGPPNNHHLHLHRPDTPAGQSDTGRSVGSGAGWITVQAKQKSFGSNGHQLSNGDGEWRHDGWEEIERESDRKSAHQRARGYQFYRGGAPNRRGMANSANQPTLRSSSLRRPANPTQPNQNHSEVSSTTPSTFQEPLVNGVSKSSKAEPNVPSTPNLPEPTTKSPVPVSTVSIGPAPLERKTESNRVESSKIDEVKVCLNPKHSVPSDTPTPEDQELKAECAIQTSEAPDKTGTCSNTSDSASLTVASSPDKKSKDEPEVKRPLADKDEAPRSGIVVKLPTTIKIGTIPVYHHSTIIPEVSGPVKIDGNSGTPLVQQPRTQLNNGGEPNGITSKARPTFDSPPLPPSSSITLGSIGGAEILREAMSAPIHHLPPPVPVPTPFVNHYHHDYYPLEPQPQQQTGMLLQGEEEDRSRHISFTPSAGSSSGNSSQTPFPHDHHSHLHQHLPSMFNSHPPPPPPPIDPQHHFNPLHHFYHPHPHAPPPLPPLQYFDPITGQHMIYPHPQQPQPLPPPPPPMFFDVPPTQPPLPPPSQPLPPSTESLLTLSTPGLYAPPPRSSKVRIKDPVSGLEKEKFGGEIKCFEHKGVTYFHQQHQPTPPSSQQQ